MVTEQPRDYTWRDALAAFTRVTEGTDAAPPGELAIAESFLRCYITELEAGRPTAEQLKRMADAVEAIRRADSFCLSTYTGPQGLVECDRRRHHTGAHSASVNHTGVIGWTDAEQDGARCPVTVPKPCVLSIRHGGNHRSNSGTVWPALVPKPYVSTDGGVHRPTLAELIPSCGVAHQRITGTVHCDQPPGHAGAHAAPGHSGNRVKWGDASDPKVLADLVDHNVKLAPDHPAAIGRIAQPGETTCPDTAPGDENTQCARAQWHDGPHMDRTAIGHGGKAGEVWE